MAKMNKEDILEHVNDLMNQLKRCRNDSEDLNSNISDINDELKMLYDQIKNGEFDWEDEEESSSGDDA